MSDCFFPTSVRSYRRWATITPSDSAIFDPLPDAIYCSGQGHLSAVGSDDVTVSFQVLGPTLLPISPKKVTTDSAGTYIALWLI